MSDIKEHDHEHQYHGDPSFICYHCDRVNSYPTIREQLDMLFHDMTAGKGTKSGEWYKAIKKVKADNPKG